MHQVQVKKIMIVTVLKYVILSHKHPEVRQKCQALSLQIAQVVCA